VDTVSTYLSHESKESLRSRNFAISVNDLLDCSLGSDEVFVPSLPPSSLGERAPVPPPLPLHPRVSCSSNIHIHQHSSSVAAANRNRNRAATTAATAADATAAAAGAAATATINRRFDCGRGPGQRYDFAICQGGGATAVAQCPALSHVHGGAGALRPESGHLAESLPAPDAFAVPQRNDNCPAE